MSWRQRADDIGHRVGLPYRWQRILCEAVDRANGAPFTLLVGEREGWPLRFHLLRWWR